MCKKSAQSPPSLAELGKFCSSGVISPRLKSGKGQRTPTTFTKENQSAPVEPVADACGKETHITKVLQIPSRMEVGNWKEKCRNWPSAPWGLGCCPGAKAGCQQRDTHRASEQEGSYKHCDPLLLNKSPFLYSPCLELLFQMENPDLTAGRCWAGVASRQPQH